ncbi:Hsp70 family protein [Pseudaestuariivita atlantica]|uniref:Molecular chaperone DnaK n=1 Tax=Pseudaestuariivita atlantica TaxID=1317121 RepID=A0A0L1JLJ0_9RHOB|nr:Hsp70 family protein [Pseudaestuariivita atlantica]KNG92619.1 molecular chaperone DnaK [Pseudaestuariivita atlantica]
MSGDVLGVDFGTSNSAVGVMRDGAPVLLPVEGGATTLPTAVFFDFDAGAVRYGRAAQELLFDGAHGRYMRALKSVLGTSLMHERRALMGERLTFVDITGRFLAHLKARAEAAAGRAFDRALSGRPVHFHSADPARDARAEDDLRACYAAAGFAGVRFLPEPVAAARANAGVLAGGGRGLIVDIGGGTSDFTLFEGDGHDVTILANGGVRLGGTDFDRLLSLDHVMGLMGRGSRIRHLFGGDTHLAPNAVYDDLATWAKIPFVQSRDTLRLAKDLARHAVEPDKLARLVRVIGDELGHDVAFAVEAAKIAANTGDTQVRLDMVERGLEAPLTRAALAASLAQSGDRLADVAEATARATGGGPEEVTHLVLVGGSSLMGMVEAALRPRFPNAALHRGAALTAIAEGLARASADPWD